MLTECSSGFSVGYSADIIRMIRRLLSVITRAGKTFFFPKNFFSRFLGFFRFLGFNLQMPDTKLQPKSTMKSKDKSSEHIFGHVNIRNLIITFIQLVTQ